MRSLYPAKTDSWTDAFHALEQHLATKDKRKKWVVFFDELPWLDGRKSAFLSAFEHFWNTNFINDTHKAPIKRLVASHPSNCPD